MPLPSDELFYPVYVCEHIEENQIIEWASLSEMNTQGNHLYCRISKNPAGATYKVFFKLKSQRIRRLKLTDMIKPGKHPLGQL